MNSLKVRLLLSTLVMTLIMLPVIGITLSNAFEWHLSGAIENELKAYSYTIFTEAEVENNQLVMPEVLLENQFNVSQSGLYAVITPLLGMNSGASVKKTLWQSQSLLTLMLPSILPSPEVGQTEFSTIEISNNSHMLFSFSVSFSENGEEFPVTLHIIKDKQQLLNATSDFREKLWTWLLVLMFVFILVQVVWLLWTLKPLNTLKQELKEIEKGNKKSLKAKYPSELQQVTQQLNTLLETEENQRKRYRNALSDLTHSLKNPLAIIQTEKDVSPNTNEQCQLINQIIERQLKKAQSAGQSAWYMGVQVVPVVDKLVKALSKIYADNTLLIHVDIDKETVFKGDEADLLEMLGNILDNAFKAAKHKISVKAFNVNNQLTIEIADDGVGIDETKQTIILSRGGRADTYSAGHGIGLAIVNDLVSSYNGLLFIGKSPALGGATFTLIFNSSK